MLWTWLREWLPFLIPAFSNFVLVLAGIWMSLPNVATSVEESTKARRSFGVLCLVFGTLALTYDATERHHAEQSSQDLFQEVKSGLDKTDVELQKTDTLLNKMSTVETCISLISALDAKMVDIRTQLSATNDTAVVAKLKSELSDVKTAKTVLSKEVIRNAWYAVSRLRNTAREWSLAEARAKDDKERDRIHGEWNQRDPLGNARPATLQLLALLPDTPDRSKEIQAQDMKFHGQAFGGTGPGPIQEDADYLEALIKRVIAANPELGK